MLKQRAWQCWNTEHSAGQDGRWGGWCHHISSRDLRSLPAPHLARSCSPLRPPPPPPRRRRLRLRSDAGTLICICLKPCSWAVRQATVIKASANSHYKAICGGLRWADDTGMGDHEAAAPSALRKVFSSAARTISTICTPGSSSWPLSALCETHTTATPAPAAGSYLPCEKHTSCPRTLVLRTETPHRGLQCGASAAGLN